MLLIDLDVAVSRWSDYSDLGSRALSDLRGTKRETSKPYAKACRMIHVAPSYDYIRFVDHHSLLDGTRDVDLMSFNSTVAELQRAIVVRLNNTYLA